MQAVVPLSVAAHRLGLTWSQAYARVLTGDLKGEKVGARWVVEQAAVDAAAKAREVATSGERR